MTKTGLIMTPVGIVKICSQDRRGAISRFTQELVQYSRLITKDSTTTASRLSNLNGSAGAAFGNF